MSVTYGGGRADFVSDLAGNILVDTPVTMWDAPTGGTQVTDLTTWDGQPLDGGIVTGAPLRFGRATDELLLLWADSGQGDRWPMMPLETVARLAAAEQNLAAAQAQAQTAQAGLDALKQLVPTQEEMLFSTELASWNGTWDPTGAFLASIMVAPFDMDILSVGLVFDYFNLAASNSAYWQATIRFGNDAGNTTVATRSSESTGADSNGAIVARRPWTFDGATWSSRRLKAGQCLQIGFSPAGSPAALNLPAAVTVRYAPA